MVSSELSAREKELVAQLKDHVAQLVDHEAPLKAFCNEHTYVRYLRARNWNLQKAAKMLIATLEWRLQYKPHLIKWEEVQSESVTGKQYVYHTVDKAGRPIVLMRPRNQNTKDTEKQIRHLIYTLEVAARQADKSGVGKFTWLLDFDGYTLSNAPPLRVSLHCNSVLANHYPERLGLACCFHAPTLFSMTWRAVQPFIDPVTKEKIKFVDKGSKEQQAMTDKFDIDQVEQCMGGNLPGYAYDHGKYTARMNEHDREVAVELQQMQALIYAAATAGDRHTAAEHPIQGIAEGVEQLTVVAS